jgi:NADH dehydrogenase FAD-containing subunit
MDRNGSGARQQIVIAGAGYAGLHVALRLAAWDDSHITCTVGARSRHRVKGHATGCL